MKTDPERYRIRHQQICERAEKQFLEERRKNPKLTVPKTVAGYAAAIRCAIVRRDGTGIVAVYAAQAAHLVLKFGDESCTSFRASSVTWKRPDTASAVKANARRVARVSSGGQRQTVRVVRTI